MLQERIKNLEREIAQSPFFSEENMSVVFSSTLRDKDNSFIQFQFILIVTQNGPKLTKWTKVDQNEPNWMKLNQIDQYGPDWTEVGVHYLFLLRFMKMTYGSLSMRGTKSFNLTLNTTLAYKITNMNTMTIYEFFFFR